MDYTPPADDRPRYMEWETHIDPEADAVYADVRWWRPAVVQHGGREASVVLDSKGEMFVFHGADRVGTASAPYQPTGPGVPEFWPLGSVLGLEPPEATHLIRDTDWMLALVDGEFGLAACGPESMAAVWHLAHAHTLLGFYPPLGVDWTGTALEFEVGVETLGERAARRVKRAFVARLGYERRQARQLSDQIEANWR